MSASSTAGTFLRRHRQFVVGAALGLIVALACTLLHFPLAYAAGANLFFAIYTGMVLAEMPKLTAKYLSKKAQTADLPVMLIFLITIAVVCVAIFSLFEVINDKGANKAELVLSLLSVPLGWLTIHVMAAIHYAHVYWLETGSIGSGRKTTAGLNFPGDIPPEGWDFLYFATVIGMTAQTADTNITTTQMRRIVLVHSIVSFFFNTVILAAAVNFAVSLSG